MWSIKVPFVIKPTRSEEGTVHSYLRPLSGPIERKPSPGGKASALFTYKYSLWYAFLKRQSVLMEQGLCFAMMNDQGILFIYSLSVLLFI